MNLRQGFECDVTNVLFIDDGGNPLNGSTQTVGSVAYLARGRNGAVHGLVEIVAGLQSRLIG